MSAVSAVCDDMAMRGVDREFGRRDVGEDPPLRVERAQRRLLVEGKLRGGLQTRPSEQARPLRLSARAI